MTSNQWKTATFLFLVITLAVFFLTIEDKKIQPGTGLASYPIYDIHEHLGEGNLDTLLYAMAQNNISYTAIMASPRYTLTLKNPGFDNYKKNNDWLVQTAKTNPIIPFCTIDPRDADALDTLKNCLANGASGLKLYNGHQSSFYEFLGPLDRDEMQPIYQYCAANNIPIVYHVNPATNNIREEFENVLSNYSQVKIDCPHWCLSSINNTRFRELYDAYPNLYTDISFGSRFAQAGFERISKNPEKYKKLVADYQDRIMFGTDMVLTSVKTKEFASKMIACYKKMLEEEQYECHIGEEDGDFSVNGTFTGLNLSDEILKKIYYENPRRFLQTASGG